MSVSNGTAKRWVLVASCCYIRLLTCCGRYTCPLCYHFFRLTTGDQVESNVQYFSSMMRRVDWCAGSTVQSLLGVQLTVLDNSRWFYCLRNHVPTPAPVKFPYLCERWGQLMLYTVMVDVCVKRHSKKVSIGRVLLLHSVTHLLWSLHVPSLLSLL